MEADTKLRLKSIGKNDEISNPYGEIICINKFSKETFVSLIEFFNKYFKRATKNITWEYPMSNFSKENSLFVLKKQKFVWFNINKPSDLVLARKAFK